MSHNIMKKQARTQASRPGTRRRLYRSTHLLALVIACVVAALAFAVPLERLPASRPLDLGAQIRLELPLPDPDENALSAPLPDDEHWQTVTVEPGDTLTRVFERLGLVERDLYAMLSAGEEARALENLLPGQVLRLRAEPRDQLQELVYETDRVSGVRIFRDGDSFKIARYLHRIEKRPAHVTGVVDGSFPASARAVGLSPALARQLQKLFGRRIDFDRQITPGDTFTVIYEEHYFEGEKIRDGQILGAELALESGRHRLVGFADPQGKLRYYTPEGQGLEPAFIRYPVRFSRVSSPYQTERLHPVLGLRRPHTGIDLAAPTGTPIRAAGDGVIRFSGWQGGYGRTLIVDHARDYSTLYAHLSRFKPGLRESSRVRRGEIIGYVGRSGLATGPHLHYEVRVNGVPHNPATVALPG
ncbi:MAG: peptidoglycan DD-metalloendopeptidase family protein, partial [Candidatus Competibacterales bacterium]|nr:peptidoglycan DD-metalloendopeptidase family protein [Candidatus Competibacterales bacterium]